MPTTRTPITRLPTTRVTPEAVAIFKRMTAPCSDDVWWDLHAELWSALKMAPWQWPAIAHPDDKCPWAAGCGGARWFPRAQRLYRELAAHAAQ